MCSKVATLRADANIVSMELDLLYLFNSFFLNRTEQISRYQQ